MTQFSDKWQAMFHNWDKIKLTKDCLHCHGTGLAPGDGETECGFCREARYQLRLDGVVMDEDDNLDELIKRARKSYAGKKAVMQDNVNQSRVWY